MTKNKNWDLFVYALERIKFGDDGKPVKCLENDLWFRIMNRSGVTVDDVNQLLKDRK